MPYDSFVTANTQKLLEEAMALPVNDRAELAAQLLATLDDAEADVESAWAAEIERRAADARRNPNDDVDWRTALDEIQREVSLKAVRLRDNACRELREATNWYRTE